MISDTDMDKQLQILVIDDDSDVAIAAQMALRRRYSDIRLLQNPAKLSLMLEQRVPDVVLLDLNFTAGRTDGSEGLTILDRLIRQNRPPAVIALTAYADVPLAVEALKRGACDFITKPWDNVRLLAAVETAAARRTTSKPGAGALSTLMGQSASMCELRAMIANVAPTEANVMILGENGVGKELVARAIHLASPRRTANFLAVDMGTIPESTIESELFGHRKGAFTDAKSDRLGRFQAAKGGVLFLDEIANLPMAGQAKLLTVLERREVTPIGLDQAESIDVRIVSATNLPEVNLFDSNLFRTDLLFRLNTIVIRVPALRERAADIPELLQHYLLHYQTQYQKPQRQISESALAQLCAHTWPGNVRALRHACERAVILSTASEYGFEDFGLTALHTTHGTLNDVGNLQKLPLKPPHAAEPKSDNFKLSEMEKEAITNAIAQAQGNISHAAKLLGLSRAALYRKLEKHAL